MIAARVSHGQITAGSASVDTVEVSTHAVCSSTFHCLMQTFWNYLHLSSSSSLTLTSHFPQPSSTTHHHLAPPPPNSMPSTKPFPCFQIPPLTSSLPSPKPWRLGSRGIDTKSVLRPPSAAPVTSPWRQWRAAELANCRRRSRVRICVQE